MKRRGKEEEGKRKREGCTPRSPGFKIRICRYNV